MDYEIKIFESGGLILTLNPSTPFPGNNNTLKGVSISATEIDFSTATSGGIFSRTFSGAGTHAFYISDIVQLIGDGHVSEFHLGTPSLTASAAPPTAVPFGVSTDLSFLILGGLYGASRLRKILAARK